MEDTGNEIELPDTISGLRRLMDRCQTRIREIEFERLSAEPCNCDRYTCSRCQSLLPLGRLLGREFVCDPV